MQRVDHELLVDGVGEGLANPQVVEGWLTQVELHVVDRAERLVALRAHAEIGVVRNPQDVAEAQARERVVVDFALLQRKHAHRPLLDVLDDDPVEQRASLDEEVVVALEDHMLTPHPLLEPERAGADRHGIHGMGLGIAAVAEDVLGDDRHQERHERLHQRRVGFAQPDHRGVGVGGIHPVHRIEHGDPEGVVLLDDGERKGDVVRRDRLAVVEAGVAVEVEGVAPFVLGDLPALGQIGLGFELVVDPHQPGEELHAETGLAARLHGGVEVAQARATGDDRGAAPLGLCCGGREGERSDCKAEDRGTSDRAQDANDHGPVRQCAKTHGRRIAVCPGVVHWRISQLCRSLGVHLMVRRAWAEDSCTAQAWPGHCRWDGMSNVRGRSSELGRCLERTVRERH